MRALCSSIHRANDIALAFTLLALIFLGGCQWLVMGEGMFVVAGEFSVRPKDCEVYLLSESGSPVPYAQREIYDQSFSEDFVVAPAAETYEVIVRCEGQVLKRVLVRYGTKIRPGQKISVGKIAIQE